VAYCSTCNAFFRDLPVTSFVFHSSLLTVKSINSVVACDGFLYIMRIIRTFHSGYFYYRGTFQTVLVSYRCVMNRTQLTENTSVLGNTIVFFIVVTLITDVLFKQFLILLLCNGVNIEDKEL